MQKWEVKTAFAASFAKISVHRNVKVKKKKLHSQLKLKLLG